MIPMTGKPTMLVALNETTVARLMALRNSSNESLDSVVDRLSHTKNDESLDHHSEKIEVRRAITGEGKYVCEVFGERVRAPTLPFLFSAIVDVFAELAPEALDRLATQGARTRRYISRKKCNIHPGRRDLPVTQTKSGWWISNNVGCKDVARALQALCSAASLEYGRDLMFWTA